MVAVVCRHYGSEELVKCGFGSNGKQRYKCNACGRRSRESFQVPGHDEVWCYLAPIRTMSGFGQLCADERVK